MCCFLVGWEAFCFQQKRTVRCSFPTQAREVSLWKLKAATKVKLITLEALEYTQVVMWCGCNIMHTYFSYRRSSAYCLPSSNFTRNVCQQSLTVSLATKKGGSWHAGTVKIWMKHKFLLLFLLDFTVFFFCQPMLLLNHRTATVPWERLKSAGHAVDKTWITSWYS